jgi:hypothetical protein
MCFELGLLGVCAETTWLTWMCKKQTLSQHCFLMSTVYLAAAAILFHSIRPNGGFEKRSLHGSCPVIKGTPSRLLT